MDVVVLAGGGSRRFGRDKLVVSRDGRRQVDVVVARLADLGGEVVVAVGSRSLGVPGTLEVGDEPGMVGPLAGLVAGLVALAAAGHHEPDEMVAVVAGDLVAPSVELLRACAEHARADGVPGAIPVVAGRVQPQHGVVAVGLAPALRASAATWDDRLGATLAANGVVAVAESTWRGWAPTARPELDIDTPEDLERLVDRQGPTRPADHPGQC